MKHIDTETVYIRIDENGEVEFMGLLDAELEDAVGAGEITVTKPRGGPVAVDRLRMPELGICEIAIAGAKVIAALTPIVVAWIATKKRRVKVRRGRGGREWIDIVNMSGDDVTKIMATLKQDPPEGDEKGQ